MSEAVEVLTGPARPILDRWFESEELKATLATDAIIGAMAAPTMPGTAYVLFHHVMGETNGKRGVWAYVKGGMGGLTQALAGAARALRRRDSHRGRGGRASWSRTARSTGVALANGEEIRARVVASNADANVTFNKLMDNRAAAAGFRRGDQPHQLRQRLAQDQRRPVGAAELHRPARHAPGPQHRGTIHICPDQDYIERAYDDAKYGRPSRTADPRMHDPVGRRSVGGAAGQAPDVDVHPVCSVQAAGRQLGRPEGGASPIAVSTCSRSTLRTSSSR